MSFFWVSFLGISLSLAVYFSLALAVWLIYTLDHLLDGYKIGHAAHTERHRFHQRYCLFLSFCWILGAMCGLVLLFYLPARVLYFGAVTVFFVGIHFLVNFGLSYLKVGIFWQKETVIAFFYSLGVSGGALSEATWLSNYLTVCWLFMMVFGLAWLNLVLISWYEFESDSKDAQASLVQKIGLNKTTNFLRSFVWILFIFWFLGFLLISPLQFFHWVLLGLMWFTLLLVYWLPSYFKIAERYRSLVDLIFLYPVCLLFIFDCF